MSRLRMRFRAEPVRLSAGQQEVMLERATGRVAERKVPLPERWIKGLTAALADETIVQQLKR